MLKRLRSIYRVLTGRARFENGMTEELRFHLDQSTADLIRSGVPKNEAERRARIEFGGVNTVMDECREARRLHPFDELTRELRYAARLLRKTPGFTITALLTLAICLGANLAIFAVIDSILLRPLPFPDPDRLVSIFNTYPKAGVLTDGSSITNYYERRGRIPALSSLALYSEATAIAGEPGSTEREELLRVTPDFFQTLQLGPVIGRGFTETETTDQTDQVAILTDTYWRQHFNADPHVIGRQLRLDGAPRTVVGVLPPNFRFLSSAARIYIPLSSNSDQRSPSNRHSGGNSKHMIARLRPGATIAQAQAQIDAQNTALEVDDPEAKMIAEAGFRSPVVSLRGDHVASIRPTLLLLQAGALLLLVIGAANLMNLLLIRANGRVKELAVRQALGAGRGHVISEVMVETTLLTLTGGLLGLAVGAGGIRLLAALGADRLPLGAQVAFDGRLALVALAGALLVGLLLAAPIAWFNIRGHLAYALQSETRLGTASRAAHRLRHMFVVAQTALALVLLAGAGLLGLSLERAMAVSPGFRADHVLSGQISLPGSNYHSLADALAFNTRLMNELARPGVIAAGIATNVPLSGNSGKSAAVVIGYVMPPGASLRAIYSYGVDGDYFAAMGFSLREGRFLTPADSRRTERVCVVDDDFARYYWPNRSALGQRLFEGGQAGPDAEAFTIVGVVGAVKQAGLTDDSAQGSVYYPFAYRGDDHLYVVARTAASPDSLSRTLQATVRRIDPDLPITNLRSMDTRIADSLITRRSPALLAGIFSAIALLLTAIGTYGVLSYAVAQRRREIGIRIALGASTGQIRAQFFSLALRLLAVGTLLGVTGAWLTGRAMRSLLYHVPPFDWLTLTAAAAILGVVSLVACVLPSHRAAKVSAVEALAEQ